MTPSIEIAADNLMTLIDLDIEAGLLPDDVATFAELHDHVDANDYALEVSPFDRYPGTWDDYLLHLNEIEAEVNVRLLERACALADA